MKIFKEARGLMRWRGLMAMPVLALLIYGCGPGFPIVTEEQQDFMDKADKASKDTASLNRRITTLENRGADKEGVEEMKLRLADTTKAVEDLSREFSFARGSMEEAGNAQAQASSEIAALDEAMRGLNERIRSLEAAKAGNAAELLKLKTALGASAKKITVLENQLALLRGTIQSPTAGAPAPSAATGEAAAAIKNNHDKAAIKAAQAAAKGQKKNDPEALYFKGFKLTKDGEFEKARAVFKSFLSLYPRSRLADHARYWLGEIYYSKGNWERAILEFDRVIKEYPGGDKVPAAILKEGFAFDRLGSKKEARLLLERVIKKYPDTPEAKMAKERLLKIKE
ncbi:MAG: tol-pal system protein YbgF [Thermodesulfobacteriota bacterium]